MSLSSILSTLRGGHSTPPSAAFVSPVSAAGPALQSAATSAVERSPIPGSWKKAALIAAAGLGIAAALAWRYYSSPTDADPTLTGRATAGLIGPDRLLSLPTPEPSAPAVTPAATLSAERNIHEERFKAAADAYLTPALSSVNYTPRPYKDFIHAQRTENHHVSEKRMHEIISEKFVARHAEEVPTFITELRDAFSIEREIAQLQETAQLREAELKARDKTLAGESRFDGRIDDAWSTYFNAHIDLLRALAPLCRFIKGEKPTLSAHEAYMLDARLTDPRSEDGTKELRAMEEGLKKFATGDAATSTQELLTRAAGFMGSEGVVSALQIALQKTDTTFEAYRALDDERNRIAGKGINPEEMSVDSDSELAHVYDPVEEARQAIIRAREVKITFLESMATSATLQTAHDAVRIDHRRIDSTGATA